MGSILRKLYQGKPALHQQESISSPSNANVDFLPFLKPRSKKVNAFFIVGWNVVGSTVLLVYNMFYNCIRLTALNSTCTHLIIEMILLLYWDLEFVIFAHTLINVGGFQLCIWPILYTPGVNAHKPGAEAALFLHSVSRIPWFQLHNGTMIPWGSENSSIIFFVLFSRYSNYWRNHFALIFLSARVGKSSRARNERMSRKEEKPRSTCMVVITFW